MPDLDGGLLSVARLEEKEMKIKFHGGKATVIEEDDTIIMTAYREGRLYEVMKDRCFAKTARFAETRLLHGRLGHVYQEAVKIVEKRNKQINETDGVVQGHPDEKCETCMEEKLRRRPYPTEKNAVTSKVLESSQ